MSENENPRNDDLGAATRALKDATAALTRLLKEEVAAVAPQAKQAIGVALRETAQGLNEATQAFARETAASENRRARAAVTREQLLDAAARLVAERGYEGASVGDIAEAAGYTKGALYSQFGSKNGLFVALARRWFDEPSEGARLDVVPEGPDAVTRWCEAAQQDPQLLLPLEFAAFALRHPESRTELADVLTGALERVAAQLAAYRTDDDTAEPTEHDRDTALAVTSVYLTANLLGAATGSPHAGPQAVARVVERILGRS
ncbi:TetR/AcrR family transcriptional regulator [Sanguibacter sp. HDW7]|uniref:TetR/AcrR family transcriptional regulator n=1 Tax=Sanguibacter sp. HDW7 TaxID=2714931 RepID=UPI0014084E46|nr:TetR/AcrR family transcriptional regulator [Sanguibacter sp. HDW7]QIK82495.1 TetR/AcrR family transcriptional regulator [Sanguibacter sp. HDW7]